MLAFVLRFLPSLTPFAGVLVNPWFWLAVVVYTAAVACFSGAKGYDVGISKLHEHLAADAVAEVKIVQKVIKLAGDVRKVYVERKIFITKYKDNVQQEVANVPSRAACNVTFGWMRGHDLSASGPGGRLDGRVDDATDSGITEAEALRTVAGNYAQYFEVGNDLRACRSFVDGLRKVDAND